MSDLGVVLRLLQQVRRDTPSARMVVVMQSEIVMEFG